MKGLYSGHVEIEKNRYRQAYGVPFEYFTKGQTFLHRPGVTVSQQDNKIDALDTLNICGAHYDAHYITYTEWPEHCLGVTTLTVQTVLGMCWKTFAKKRSVVSYGKILMTAPVFDGDTLYAESEILETMEDTTNKECGIVSVLTKGINSKGDIVTQIEYKLSVYKEGYHPLDKHKVVSSEENEGIALFRTKGENRFLETTGMFLEEVETGVIYEHRPGKTITNEDLRIHALHCLDRMPQYSDKHYIDTHLQGRALVNEAYVISSVIGLTTGEFGRGAANLEMKDIQLPNPVYVDDTIYAESELLSTRISKSRPNEGILSLRTRAYNQKNDLVCCYDRALLYYRKGQGPYEAAGY